MMLPVSRRIIHLAPGDFWLILNLLGRDRVLDGPGIGVFERRFAGFIGTRNAVAAATGRLGLSLLLDAYNLPEGGEIILPAYEDLSVPKVISDAGLKPVCVDIDTETNNIDPREIARRLSDRTAAVIVAHLFGNPCDMDAIKRVLKSRNIVLLEDCAHAVGSTIDGRHVGTFGDAAFFSFHTTKPFMTFGGCMVTTDNDEVAEHVRSRTSSLPFPNQQDLIKRIITAYLMHLLTHRFFFPWTLYPILRLCNRLGVNPVSAYNKTLRKSVKIAHTTARYTNLQAMIGLRHLNLVEEHRCRRLANARILDEELAGLVEKPAVSEGFNGYFWLLYTDGREKARHDLFRLGIDTGNDLMRDCSLETGDAGECPQTAEVRKRSLQVPI
ncbi:MAG: DegT/DnrJ/EryC1/StrS family aminotransferase, partial [bacterium]|nr:DegT/DnrJ/EryC1/StrS family aminotransferase [bacterium]